MKKKLLSIALAFILLISPLSFSKNVMAMDVSKENTSDIIDSNCGEIEIIPNDNYIANDAVFETETQSQNKENVENRSVVGNNGIYAIQKASTNVYVKCNAFNGTSWTFQGIYTTTPTTESYRDNLFKITYRSSTNDYVIRSMKNNELFLCPSVENNAPIFGMVNVNGVSATDSNLPVSATWKISTSSDGYSYIFYNKNGTNYYMRSSNNNNEATLNFTTNINDAGTKWDFRQYTGGQIDGTTVLSDSRLLLQNTTFDYDVCMYSSVVGRNGPIVYSVSEPDHSPTDKATINSTTGVLTVNKGGLIRVKWTYNNAPWIWSVLVNLQFEDGIVHTLNNVSVNKLMKPITESSGSYLTVETYNYNNKTSMWKFEYAGNGYYKIKNDVTNCYLTAPSNNAENAPVTQGAYNSTYGLWMIQKTADGYFTLQSKNQYTRTTTSPLYLTISNNQVVQSSNTTNYKWNIKELTLNLNLYYDQLFASTYNSIGVNAVDAIDNIVNNNLTQEHRNVEEFFKDEFGIKVKTTIISSVYESFPYTTDCLHKNNYNECNNCKNVSITPDTSLNYCMSGHHHKSANKFVECTPSSDVTANIIFTGHQPTCGYDGNDHSSKTNIGGRAEGSAVGNRCAVFLGTFVVLYGDITNYDIIKVTFVHELLHLLGVTHHYESGQNNCVHGKDRNKSYVYTGLTICGNCVNAADSNKLKVLYSHN